MFGFGKKNEAQPLSDPQWDQRDGCYVAQDGDGNEYRLDADVVAEAQQQARRDKARGVSWDTSMDGVRRNK